MQAKAIAVAAVLGVAALGWSSAPANAATCVRNSIFNDVGGHRTLIRSETRCGVAPRVVHRAPRTVRTTRTVIDDDYVTTSRPYTTVRRDYYYSEPVTRTFDEEIYSGSSMPAPRPFWWGGY
jgi:hypothetical protein